MHPAYSVILFTTASGAGYGLLVWLALLAVAGAVPAEPLTGIVGLGLAFALIVSGLLSSTAHLGRPERAWRAFSQWRTSWLSREGVAAVVTFVPFAALALGWVVYSSVDETWSMFAIAAAAMALVTVWCTGMIYQSLPTIRAWSLPIVTPVYLVLALSTGAVLATVVLAGFDDLPAGFPVLAAVLAAVAVVLKRRYWQQVDALATSAPTTGDATGLGRFGVVRPLDPPHTQPNYIMREMGFAVARRHSTRLRGLVQAAFVAAALLELCVALSADEALLAIPLAALAVLAIGFGVLVERWLFFAEARHVVMTYYAGAAA